MLGRVMCATVMVMATGAWGAPPASAPATTAPAFKLKIGYDTTRVMGPVLPDGTIDYTVALWEHMHRGVTAENNAYPLLASATREMAKAPPSAADELPKDKRRNPDLGDNVQDWVRFHPWKASDYPLMAAWIKKDEPALTLAEVASRKTRMCPPKPAPGTVQWKDSPPVIDFVTPLSARAMERLELGDQQAAMNDAETMQRLASLMAGSDTSLGFFITNQFESSIFRVALIGARTGNITQKRQWLAFVLSLPEDSMPPTDMDTAWRFERLNEVMEILRGNAQSALSELTLMDMEHFFIPNATGTHLLPGDLNQVDWNIVLQKMNALFDDKVRILREPPLKAYKDGLKLRASLKKISSPDNFFDALERAMVSPEKGSETQQKESVEQQVNDFLKRRDGETRAQFSGRIADYFSKTDGESFDILPQMGLGNQAGLRNTEIAIALEIYHDQHGKYPQRLSRLAPGILAKVPADPFSETGAELQYVQRGAGYVVYSIGRSGHDTLGGPRQPRPEIAVYSANDPDAR